MAVISVEPGGFHRPLLAVEGRMGDAFERREAKTETPEPGPATAQPQRRLNSMYTPARPTVGSSKDPLDVATDRTAAAILGDVRPFELGSGSDDPAGGRVRRASVSATSAISPSPPVGQQAGRVKARPILLTARTDGGVIGADSTGRVRRTVGHELTRAAQHDGTPIRVRPARSLAIQRDIAPGQALPDPQVIGQQRLWGRADAAVKGSGFLGDLQTALGIPPVFVAFRAQYNPPPFLPPITPAVMTLEANAAHAALGALVVARLGGDPALCTKDAVWAGVQSFTVTPHQQQLAQAFVDYVVSDVAGPVAMAGAVVSFTNAWNRPQGAQFGAAMSRAERSRFTAALKTLPLVGRLAGIHGHKDDLMAPRPRNPDLVLAGGVRVGGGVAEPLGSRWGNGGWLNDSIVLDATTNPQAAGALPVPAHQYESDPYDDGTVEKKVLKVDRLIRMIVEPQVLGAVRRPVLHVHPMKSNHFRAFQRLNQVHFAVDEGHEVIAHEVGHYLETSGAIETWLDIQKLIDSRHQQAGGGAVATPGSFGMREEGRFKGQYPATGKYTSKAYDDGATEVMSMTIEHLTRGKTFEQLLKADPLQTAIVLRGLAPNEYAGANDLRPFDQYLPS